MLEHLESLVLQFKRTHSLNIESPNRYEALSNLMEGYLLGFDIAYSSRLSHYFSVWINTQRKRTCLHWLAYIQIIIAKRDEAKAYVSLLKYVKKFMKVLVSLEVEVFPLIPQKDVLPRLKILLIRIKRSPSMYLYPKSNYLCLSNFIHGTLLAIDIIYKTELNASFSLWVATKEVKNTSHWINDILKIGAEGDEDKAYNLLINYINEFIAELLPIECHLVSKGNNAMGNEEVMHLFRKYKHNKTQQRESLEQITNKYLDKVLGELLTRKELVEAIKNSL